MPIKPNNPALPKESLVHLSRNFTQIHVTPEIRTAAIQSAYWVTASPHEWVWKPEEQANMARYVLWASQRLEVLEQLARLDQPLTHEPTT